MTTQLTLNQGQKEAEQGFFDFLLSDEKELIISGGGGVGKTFLMGHLIDVTMPRYHEACELLGVPPRFTEVMMTATTNPAAEVLGIATNRPTQTIHSYMNLVVRDDFTTGQSILSKSKAWVVHHNKIIFIDEAFTIDKPLMEYIREGTCNCKIVYVGDHCQLPPVKYSRSPIEDQRIPFYELKEPMRNAGQPALLNVSAQLRATVESLRFDPEGTGAFQPIQIVPDVIDWLDGPEMKDMIDAKLMNHPHGSKILAYSNDRVVAYNDHIRGIRNLPEHYVVGDELVNNSAIRIGRVMLSNEMQVTIVEQADGTEDFMIEPTVSLTVRNTTLKNKYGDFVYVQLPEDRNHYQSLLKYYKRIKAWTPFYAIKNNIPDLRPADASTVHKAQGSSFNEVFIDLDNLSKCTQPLLTARLLYVAFTRARNRIYLYGELAQKYGGLTQ